ncbi:MAG: PAS-domain containing protein, partial [Alphaproteobacteria bacterium]
ADAASFDDVVAGLAVVDRAVLTAAVAALRHEDAPFALRLARDGADEALLLVRGVPLDGGSIVWLTDAGLVGAAVAQARAERDRFREVLEALAFPVWRRGADLALAWCNRAYAQVVEASDGADAVSRGVELAGPAAGGAGRDLAEQAVAHGTRASGDVPVVMAGQRRVVNVIETALGAGQGTIGAAQDVTEAEAARRDLERHIMAQKDVMANLATPIAVYGTDKRLTFFNDAFARLWRLDAAWLGAAPTYGEILDAMRERRLLPETGDYRAYKRQLLEAFATIAEPAEDVLHRPDGSTMRVAMTPHPLGGLVFTYEDVTGRLALERSLNTQVAVQRATLDNLFEGVAVFGSDGRLKLSNPGFARLWRLDEATLGHDTHIADVLEWTRDLHDYGADWDGYKAGVIAQISERSPVSSRIERTDGTVLEIASVPLPDGATLMTYLDVTDSIQKQRALTERTEALETADRLKSEFIANISYELRTPLNTIAGFAEILANQYFGPLTERQGEYCEGILDATQQLTNTINDILDLASIEAGQITLHLDRFDLHRAVTSMVGLLQRRAELERLALVCDCDPAVGEIVADQRRIKQIVFNLMSNAFKFTPPGGRVALDVRRDGGEIVIAVTDTGVGIHADERSRVFDRFQRGRGATRRPGTGIGLALVKSFVELHGGSISLESHPNTGTRVVCRLPAETGALATAEVHAA